MVRFFCHAPDSQGRIGISLSKYETTYRAEVVLSNGTIIITKQKDDQKPVELAAVPIKKPKANKKTLIKFANVDHQLIFEYDGTKWKYDLGRYPDDTGEIRKDIEPQVKIIGSGKLTLSHVAIYRDIHYTESMGANSGVYGRATKVPFVLGKDEFFVLGDNSPNSEDCRWWSAPGMPNKGIAPLLLSIDLKYERNFENRFISQELRQEFENKQILLSQSVDISDVQSGRSWLITDNMKEYLVKKEFDRIEMYPSPYRAGIVPRDYLVGKALFVYWPSGFKPFTGFPFGIIPNYGRMRFIYGGSK